MTRDIGNILRKKRYKKSFSLIYTVFRNLSFAHFFAQSYFRSLPFECFDARKGSRESAPLARVLDENKFAKILAKISLLFCKNVTKMKN